MNGAKLECTAEEENLGVIVSTDVD